MTDAIIAALLEWNPWLEGTFPTALLGIPRDYSILSYIEIPEIKILEGIRRSGKSTLLYQVAAFGVSKGKKVLYINFEDEILRLHSLSEIYYAFLERGQIDYLLLDEIQYCKDWVPFIRKFHDRKVLTQIWITGSNSSLIKREYAEMLTGRNIKLNIMPLSFPEYLQFKNFKKVQFPLTHEREAEIKKAFEDYLNQGAFPAAVLRPIHQRELLINYFEDFLFKDIATRYTVNTSKLRDLAIYLATNSAKILSYRNIAKALNLHINTVMDYISYFRESFLFNEVYKFDYSLQKQFVHDKKIYIADTGLGKAVSFQFSTNRGHLLETVVYSALKRQKKEIFFHREKKECDFIVKRNLEIHEAIQVCHSLTDVETKERELDGLLDALKIYHNAQGVILTSHEADSIEIKQNNRCYKIDVKPIWKWLLENEV